MTVDLDHLPLALLGEVADTMPWFKKLRFGKKRHKKAKKEISEPSSFQHCYHATFDSTSGEFVGLPPQWMTLVGSASERPQKSPPSSNASSTTSAVSPVVASSIVQPPLLETRTTVGPVEAVALTAEGEGGERGGSLAGECSSDKTPETSDDRSMNSSPVSPTTTREGAASRPVPIIRGSDDCLEETIKYIRKHYRSSSSASPGFEEDATETEEQFIDIHFGSRSRSGSLLLLRGAGSPGNSHVTSSAPSTSNRPYTSSSTNTMNNTSRTPLASKSAFCLSAPHDLNVAQLDLGLYDCDTSSASNTTLFRSRIHSPCESSGYFGSTMSSLCSSRISALSSVPQIHPTAVATATQPVATTTHQHRCSTLRETSELPLIHPQMKPGKPYFSSLQRPSKCARETHAMTPRAYAHGNTGSNAAAFVGSPPGHYGTTPRAYAHRPRGESVDNGLMCRNYRNKTQHESSRLQYNRGVPAMSSAAFADTHSHTTMPVHAVYSSTAQHTNTTPQPRHAQAVSKSKMHHQKRLTMTSEQFRTTLELLVNRSDPRKDIGELAKIGEGSTGLVYLAQEVSTRKKVAVKKMNIRRQQRRELLFNEVCVRVCVYIHVQCLCVSVCTYNICPVL